ncbi:MAG: hypothetical protein JRD94_05850 [Deltaproteobacteria bacterium]|nr:hypothetical protein [Deltaproteobacteria bacterium]
MAEQRDQRLRAPSRCAYDDDFAWHPREHGGIGHVRLCLDNVGIECQVPDTRPAEGKRRQLLDDLHFLDELRSQALERGVRALRFLDEVDRSELERAKNVLFRRQAGYHDDGKRMPVHQQLEELELPKNRCNRSAIE